jgi:hypothetical protein
MEVKERIRHLKKSQVSPPKPIHQIVMKKKSSRLNFLTIFLGFWIFMMSVLTLGLLMYKNILKDEGDFSQNVIQEKIIERETIIDNPAYLTRTEAEDRFGKIESDLSGLEGRVKTWSYRSWITAVVTNENAHLANQVDRRYHPQYQPDYLKMDENWKINMPKHQTLTDDQRESIKRGGFK